MMLSCASQQQFKKRSSSKASYSKTSYIPSKKLNSAIKLPKLVWIADPSEKNNNHQNARFCYHNSHGPYRVLKASKDRQYYYLSHLKNHRPCGWRKIDDLLTKRVPFLDKRFLYYNPLSRNNDDQRTLYLYKELKKKNKTFFLVSHQQKLSSSESPQLQLISSSYLLKYPQEIIYSASPIIFKTNKKQISIKASTYKNRPTLLKISETKRYLFALYINDEDILSKGFIRKNNHLQTIKYTPYLYEKITLYQIKESYEHGEIDRAISHINRVCKKNKDYFYLDHFCSDKNLMNSIHAHRLQEVNSFINSQIYESNKNHDISAIILNHLQALEDIMLSTLPRHVMLDHYVWILP